MRKKVERKEKNVNYASEKFTQIAQIEIVLSQRDQKESNEKK